MRADSSITLPPPKLSETTIRFSSIFILHLFQANAGPKWWLPMKLVRLNCSRTGLLVDLPGGTHVFDVVGNLNKLIPDDPVSHGILNGILKDHGSWVSLIQHWPLARAGLRRLAAIAISYPGSVELRHLDRAYDPAIPHPDGIGSIDIGESEVRYAHPEKNGSGAPGNRVIAFPKRSE
jgi:hypothetical protein